MATFAFRQSAGLQTVELDGEDISRAVRSVGIDAEAGGLPAIRLELAVFELETAVGESEIHLAPGTEDLLKRLGWTPPEEMK